jgi:hydroxymethylglutaryl-CoA lyase
MTLPKVPMPNKVHIYEVGPRDGLQNEPNIWSVEERVNLIDQLGQTGISSIEAVSFVNPKQVPQMADAEIVMAKIKRPSGLHLAGLALNMRGVERAIDCGVDEVRCVVVASETFNQKNQGKDINATMIDFEAIADRVHKEGLRFSLGIAAAFGCPFEGIVEVSKVVSIAKRMNALDPANIWVADTIGCAVPTQVETLLESLVDAIGEDLPLGCHFHNTRNTGYANAINAINHGATFLDSSIGGIGGCPFAPQATGNIATEDLAYMLRNMNIETGIDLEQLMNVSTHVGKQLGIYLPGQLARAGAFPEVAIGQNLR